MDLKNFVWQAYDECKKYSQGDSRPLERAIRNRPEIFEDQLTRDFVAEIIAGERIVDRRQQSPGYHERNQKIVNEISYMQGLGVPLGGKAPLTCYKEIEKLHNITQNTTKDIWKKRKEYTTALTLILRHEGEMRRQMNNGYAPLSSREIEHIK